MSPRSSGAERSVDAPDPCVAAKPADAVDRCRDRATPDGRWLERAHRTLRANGARMGAARAEVMDVLACQGQCLVTPQAIIDTVVGERATGSASSVYRALEELERLGLLRRVVGPDNVARVEIDQPDHQHHHFIDLPSGQVVPFHDAGLERVIGEIADRLGVDLTGYEVLLSGRRRPAAD